MKRNAVVGLAVLAIFGVGGVGYAMGANHGGGQKVRAIALATIPPTSQALPTTTTTEATVPTTQAAPVAAPPSVAITTTTRFACPTGTMHWSVQGFTAQEGSSGFWNLEAWGSVRNDANAAMNIAGGSIPIDFTPPPNDHYQSSPYSLEVSLNGGITVQPGQTANFDGGGILQSTTQPVLSGGVSAPSSEWVDGHAILNCSPPR